MSAGNARVWSRCTYIDANGVSQTIAIGPDAEELPCNEDLNDWLERAWLDLNEQLQANTATFALSLRRSQR